MIETKRRAGETLEGRRCIMSIISEKFKARLSEMQEISENMLIILMAESGRQAGRKMIPVALPWTREFFRKALR